MKIISTILFHDIDQIGIIVILNNNKTDKT